MISWVNVWVKEFSVLWIDATPPTWLPDSWTQGGHTSCVCVVLKHYHSWLLCFCSSAGSRTMTCLMSLKCCSRDFGKEFLCLFSLVMFHGWDWISGEGCTCPNVHLWQFPSYQCWRWRLWQVYTDPSKRLGQPTRRNLKLPHSWVLCATCFLWTASAQLTDSTFSRAGQLQFGWLLIFCRGSLQTHSSPDLLWVQFFQAEGNLGWCSLHSPPGCEFWHLWSLIGKVSGHVEKGLEVTKCKASISSQVVQSTFHCANSCLSSSIPVPGDSAGWNFQLHSIPCLEASFSFLTFRASSERSRALWGQVWPLQSSFQDMTTVSSDTLSVLWISCRSAGNFQILVTDNICVQSSGRHTAEDNYPWFQPY